MKNKSGSKQHEASFRDSDGFIFEEEGKILRQVNNSYKADYDQLISSGLYKELVNNRLLTAHKEISLDHAFSAEAYKILEPLKIDFISYPYEWCFSQLKEAALLTLKLQSIALKFGMSLKDASAFNIQFVNGEPQLIDILSFELLVPKPWVAYRQFCQHFLGPLVLMSKIDPGLNRLLSIYLDGVPIDLTAKLLPFISKFYPSIFIHIQLHSLMKEKKSGSKKQIKPGPTFSKRSLTGLIDSLTSAIESLKLPKNNSFWSSYVPSSDSYTPSAFKYKEKIISDFFIQTKAKKVWDLGSNTGHFSRLVSKLGADVYSFDADPLSVEKNYQLSLGKNRILQLVLDLTNPSPDLGWSGKERKSIIERGPADTILALALIHHLVIGSNIPLEKVAEFLSGLCCYLIIEFVPKTDPQVIEMLRLREDIFVNYNEGGFEKAFGNFFKIIKKTKIRGSLRSMYLMKTK